MSFYKKIVSIGTKFISKQKMFRYGFNLSPMYRRSTGRIVHVSEDLHKVQVKLPISWRNINYVNSIFGGSLFAAVDPVPMIQLMNILGEDYVVWDKSAEINFLKPAREDVYADFIFKTEEIENMKRRIQIEKEIVVEKATELTNESGSIAYCSVNKKIYIADKQYYKSKIRNNRQSA